MQARVRDAFHLFYILIRSFAGTAVRSREVGALGVAVAVARARLAALGGTGEGARPQTSRLPLRKQSGLIKALG
jgi:hypothetical protein